MLADENPEPGELPGPGTGTWRLNQDSCTPTLVLGGLACYAAAGNEGAGASVVYGHVARVPGAVVLEYWFFYYDDVYSYTYPPSDFIWQAHECDWEAVSVVLSEDEQPQYVGYSQHCLGQRRAWSSTPLLGTHPVVYVADGSHANYFTAGIHPINVQCIPPPAIAFLQAVHLPLPADHVFDGGEVAGPPEAGGTFTHLRVIDDGHPSWVSFPGSWGEAQYFHAPAPIGTVPFGTSPQGPAYHSLVDPPARSRAGFGLRLRPRRPVMDARLRPRMDSSVGAGFAAAHFEDPSGPPVCPPAASGPVSGAILADGATATKGEVFEGVAEIAAPAALQEAVLRPRRSRRKPKAEISGELTILAELPRRSPSSFGHLRAPTACLMKEPMGLITRNPASLGLYSWTQSQSACRATLNLCYAEFDPLLAVYAQARRSNSSRWRADDNGWALV
jgi:hypothetical protein